MGVEYNSVLSFMRFGYAIVCMQPGCWRSNLHSAAVALLSRLQKGISTHWSSIDTICRGSVQQAGRVDLLQEPAELLLTAAAEQLGIHIARKKDGENKITEGKSVILFGFGRSICFRVYVQVKGWTHPTLSDMMQPFFVFEEPQTQFSVSWDKPRLWPISCAIVEATPIEFVLWSWRQKWSWVEINVTQSTSISLYCLHLDTNVILDHERSPFTSLTAPELEVHIALVLASPTVEPSKSTPLSKGEEKCLDGSSDTVEHHLRTVFVCVSRDKLCVVMFVPPQQSPLTPLEEAAKGDLRVSADLDLIFVRPDIQADQHHTDTNRAIQLARSSMLA